MMIPSVWCGPFWPRSPLGRSRGGVLDIPVQDFFLTMWRG
jgi:hypothetical protein